ncbi:replication-associated recombination protein A [Tetragenococcus koreensis]|uniref:Replication-associated recombination protein A n=1 Tax=Tetragenococcus halophilus TaxID=51669 RepID=A0AB37D5B6_TETHA|nr:MULTISPECIES: replication-associated recombination protein A [Tetragenococcus]MCF1584441.1 replication-associated recombination protein A [Tetragenococcus koreensis]MCF1613990.1 replication-associated recombination protein A [Tetragenococcus koreensis]MCF1619795.1 replication-associated recombination protein A [Tetragenococcus koreensis]MCF1623724.1 replication-associated recombination protein A [Tetragenococcus koreensis]MCF1628679.1 replication-associated recombination protein A [Tetragen
MKQESLFSNRKSTTPLASRVRPKTIDDFVGQKQLLGQGKILREIIEQDQVSSMIFWGPPGVGKTTLAEIIARKTKANFITVSAVNSGIKKIKDLMEEAETNRDYGEKTIIFVDEIHRFNKAQQDAFLPYVEKGSIILIGTTTENPSFEVNSALLSRCKVFVLNELTVFDIVELLKRAIKNPDGFGDYQIVIDDRAIEAIARFANGDARSALNTLEMAVLNGEKDGMKIAITTDTLEQMINKKSLLYDKSGEEHYNIISALHKSMRNSDVNAAIYWLARMLEGGEDPLYIARRLVRFASEDIGLADTNALNVAVNVFQSCQFLGMPECDVHLTELVIYLSLAPKSNAVYKARLNVKKDIKESINEPVPLQIRNAPTDLMKDLGYGKDYEYAHQQEQKLTTMKTMPPALEGHEYYFPTEEGKEERFKKRLEYIKHWHEENG